MTDPITTNAITIIDRTIDFFKNNPDGWTRGVFARDKNDTPVTPVDERATCFCVIGRLRYEGAQIPRSGTSMLAITGGARYESLMTLNDASSTALPIMFELSQIRAKLERAL